MKRKNSFVTNSSSTSYILNTGISGKIIPAQTKDNLTDLFKDITRSFPTIDNLKLTCTIADFSGPSYVAAKFEEIDDGDNYRQFSFNIDLRYATDYEDEPKEVIYVYIQSNYRTTEQSKELPFLQDVLIELLYRIVMYSSHCRNKFVYVKTPTDMTSGGWDGGDAMGFYKETMECMADELEIGTILITAGSKPKIVRKSLIKK
jgi:hypothetical protein